MPTKYEPIQILSMNDQTHKFELHLNQLEHILDQEDVRDCNLAVVSICGAFRKGKSFMLSFFLRYLKETYVKNNFKNWLNCGQNNLRDGFEWRGGSNRHTTGIWVWPQIFTAELSNGENIAVLLMDTQGTFDPKSTQHDNVTIFSLTTMLSSVQIYNLMQNIQEDDLQNLQLYTEYGKLVIDSNFSAKPFQSLIFLVRDWPNPNEADYGFAGGQKTLNNYLKITSDQHPELRNLREHIRSCYDELKCCLFPCPGKKVKCDRNFNGSISDIDEEFVEALKEFVPGVLHKNTVLPKKINGVNMKAKEFTKWVKQYYRIFSSGNTPNAQSILAATVELNNSNARSEAIEYYDDEMAQFTGAVADYTPFEQVVAIHERFASKAINIFITKSNIGDESQRRIHRDKLDQYLQRQLACHLGSNEAKKTGKLDEMVQNLNKQIENYRATNEKQLEILNTLRQQMEQYEKKSERERREYQDQIDNLMKCQAEAMNKFTEQIRKNDEKYEREREKYQKKIDQLERNLTEQNAHQHSKEIENIRKQMQKMEQDSEREKEKIRRKMNKPPEKEFFEAAGEAIDKGLDAIGKTAAAAGSAVVGGVKSLWNKIFK